MQTDGANSKVFSLRRILARFLAGLRMRSAGARWGLAAAAALLALLAAAAGVVGWRAARAVHLSAEEVRSEGQIRFSVRSYRPAAGTEFEVLSAPAVFLAAAKFQDQLYIAGPSGLQVYDLRGAALVRQFAVERDLPSSPIVALAPAVLADAGEPELVIATASDGLLAYDGRGFRQIYPLDADSRAITAILPTADGHLLIGTKKLGVLLSADGEAISAALHPKLELWPAMCRRSPRHGV